MDNFKNEHKTAREITTLAEKGSLGDANQRLHHESQYLSAANFGRLTNDIKAQNEKDRAANPNNLPQIDFYDSKHSGVQDTIRLNSNSEKPQSQSNSNQEKPQDNPQKPAQKQPAETQFHPSSSGSSSSDSNKGQANDANKYPATGSASSIANDASTIPAGKKSPEQSASQPLSQPADQAPKPPAGNQNPPDFNTQGSRPIAGTSDGNTAPTNHANPNQPVESQSHRGY